MKKILIIFSTLIIIFITILLFNLGLNGIKGIYIVGLNNKEIYYSSNYDYFFSKNNSESINEIVSILEKNHFKVIEQLGDTIILEKDNKLFNLTKQSFFNKFYTWDLKIVDN